MPQLIKEAEKTNNRIYAKLVKLRPMALTNTDLAKELGIPPLRVANAVCSLRDKGFIKRLGNKGSKFAKHYVPAGATVVADTYVGGRKEPVFAARTQRAVLNHPLDKLKEITQEVVILRKFKADVLALLNTVSL